MALSKTHCRCSARLYRLHLGSVERWDCEYGEMNALFERAKVLIGLGGKFFFWMRFRSWPRPSTFWSWRRLTYYLKCQIPPFSSLQPQKFPNIPSKFHHPKIQRIPSTSSNFHSPRFLASTCKHSAKPFLNFYARSPELAMHFSLSSFFSKDDPSEKLPSTSASFPSF